MESCYDCIHCDACSDAGDSGFSSLVEDVSECKHFKNKADVVEVKHGEWIEDFLYDTPCVCSLCGAEAPCTTSCHEQYDYDYDEDLVFSGIETEVDYIKTPYCPNCGAKMKREKEINEQV